MAEDFREKLLCFIHKTVKIYTDCGTLQGFMLSVCRDYIEVMSICTNEKYKFAPRVITVIPIEKICAISRFECGEARAECRRGDFGGGNLHIGWLVVLIIALMSINPVFTE
jgi:hypothetical protein